MEHRSASPALASVNWWGIPVPPPSSGSDVEQTRIMPAYEGIRPGRELEYWIFAQYPTIEFPKPVAWPRGDLDDPLIFAHDQTVQIPKTLLWPHRDPDHPQPTTAEEPCPPDATNAPTPAAHRSNSRTGA